MGGTFDPVHLGHLLAAEAAREALQLDRVVWLPAGDPPHKQGRPITPAEHRLEMVRRAIEGNPRFEASRLELDREGPSYTLDTLKWFQGEHPDAELYFLTGMDTVLELHTWHRPREVLAACRMVAMVRPGVDDAALVRAFQAELTRGVIRVNSPRVEISATDLRERVARGASIRYRTPDAVCDYIIANRLYRAHGAPAPVVG